MRDQARIDKVTRDSAAITFALFIAGIAFILLALHT